MAGDGINYMATPEELRRLHVIQKVWEGELKQVEAAEIISLSCRHIRRVVQRVREEGQGRIVHRLRGRPSNRKIADQLKDKVVKLYRTTYKGFFLPRLRAGSVRRTSLAFFSLSRCFYFVT